MKIRNKKIIAIITILVITIIYGIWKENKGKIKIENINEQAEITDIEDNEKTKNLHEFFCQIVSAQIYLYIFGYYDQIPSKTAVFKTAICVLASLISPSVTIFKTWEKGIL